MIKYEIDIAVIGAGFAGSLSALILNQMGLRCILIDRTAHPRFAVGESSTPIANMVLRDLAKKYDLPRLLPLTRYGPWQQTYPHLLAGRKRGFSYFSHTDGQAFLPFPDHRNELMVAASNDDALADTHWFRADVDAFFTAEARAAGIPVLENTTLNQLMPAQPWLLSGSTDGTPLQVSAGFVVDASGGGGALQNALGLSDTSAALHTHSRTLFSHFSGVTRWQSLLEATNALTADYPFSCDDAALHHLLDGGWMWMLRFNNDLVSAGLVLDTRRHPLDPAVSAREEWASWLARYPSLGEQLAHAEIAQLPGSIIRTGPLQRRIDRAAGPHWALLPHTAGFIDPLHSTGIAHSLCGVERLMKLLKTHWDRPTLAEALSAYDTAIQKELAFIDRLVACCYAALPDFKLFTAASMLYFAGTIAYERGRAGLEEAPPDRLYLCADETPLFDAAGTALERMQAGDQAGAFSAFVEEAVAPYNSAGLFHPAVPNMYHHTAAPV